MIEEAWMGNLFEGTVGTVSLRFVDHRALILS